MAKLVRDRAAARSVSASLLLSGRYLVIATSLKGPRAVVSWESGPSGTDRRLPAKKWTFSPSNCFLNRSFAAPNCRSVANPQSIRDHSTGAAKSSKH